MVADELGCKLSSLSPARDGLIKKGLIYSSERGLIAFTVPHFGKFLRSNRLAGARLAGALYPTIGSSAGRREL